mgnify:CR=1 FL=1
MKSSISFDSNLAKFGIGLFETIKVKDGQVNLQYHMDRLFISIKDLNLNFNYEKVILEEEILKYIKKNKIQNKALRLTLFDEGYNISTRDIIYDKKSYDDGFKLNISPIKRGNSIIYRHKTTNYFENIYTKNHADINGFNDGIFIDIDNNILECSMSNIFFIKDNIVYTPSEKLPILNGTTKRKIEKLCIELSIEIKKSNISINEIGDFDFVFVSNAIMGVMKVVQIEDFIYDKDNDLFEIIKENINN